jgi:hypothetical protein
LYCTIVCRFYSWIVQPVTKVSHVFVIIALLSLLFKVFMPLGLFCKYVVVHISVYLVRFNLEAQGAFVCVSNLKHFGGKKRMAVNLYFHSWIFSVAHRKVSSRTFWEWLQNFGNLAAIYSTK